MYVVFGLICFVNLLKYFLDLSLRASAIPLLDNLRFIVIVGCSKRRLLHLYRGIVSAVTVILMIISRDALVRTGT